MTTKSYRKGPKIYNVEETPKPKPKETIQSNAKTNKKPPQTKDQIGSMEGQQASGETMLHHSKRLPPLTKVEKKVLQCIIGQDEQVRQILTSIYRAQVFETIKSNVLIIGASGTGKTETIRQIAKQLRVPYTIEDATKYTQEGYYGNDVNDMIYHLIENADEDLERAEHGIIVIDEIDKKAGDSRQQDVAGVEVLNSLLKIIEGTSMEINLSGVPYLEDPYEFQTQNITVIFCGAFAGLEKIRDKRLNKNQLGFSEQQHLKESKQRFLKRDLVKYGMPEEFVGRIDTIVEMNKLTESDLAKILSKSKLSIFRRYQQELQKQGISLQYNGKLFKDIAANAMDLDTGARELSNVVNYMFQNITYEVLANPGKYQNCVISKSIVYDNTKYVLS